MNVLKQKNGKKYIIYFNNLVHFCK